MLNEPGVISAGLVLGALERIGPQVEDLWRAKRHKRLHPDFQPIRLLLQECDLVLVEAQAGEIAIIGPVEELAAPIALSPERSSR